MTQQTDRLNAALAGRYHVERELGTERFPSEIKTTAKLQDAHILPLLDSGDAGGLRYYVMPVVTGETLRTRLERETQLPIDDAVRIGRNGERTRLRASAGRRLFFRPRFSPDSRRIAFGTARASGAGIDVWRYQVESRSLQRLTSDSASGEPEWDQGGRGVVFRRSAIASGGPTRLYRIPAEGARRFRYHSARPRCWSVVSRSTVALSCSATGSPTARAACSWRSSTVRG